MDFRIKLPTAVTTIITQLNTAGYEAYIVGGCVRDSLIGITPHDWDITTSATPDEVKEVLESYRILDTGLKHGTVTVMVGTDAYEITTYRVDGEYSDGRHPDEVSFTPDLRDDLSRRDFTINAMAYNHIEGLIDPFYGRKDLGSKTLSCVGSPDKRFNEDGLRILRALRFASTYGFKIESRTSEAIHQLKDNLKKISAERIRAELVKLLSGTKAKDILIEYSDVIATIIPELAPCIGFDQNNKYHIYTVYDHIAHAVDGYEGSDVVINMALLLHDIAKPECYVVDDAGHGHFYGHPEPCSRIADKVMHDLKFDNKTRASVVELVKYHDTKIAPTKKSVRRMLNKIGELQYRKLLIIQRCDVLAHAPIVGDDRLTRLGQVRCILDELIAEQQCFTLKDLAVKGTDILALGIHEGPFVGELLQYLLKKVIDEDVPNDHDILMQILKDHIGICD